MESSDAGAKRRPQQMEEGKDEKIKRDLPLPFPSVGRARESISQTTENAGREMFSTAVSKIAVKN